jgi:integrase
MVQQKECCGEDGENSGPTRLGTFLDSSARVGRPRARPLPGEAGCRARTARVLHIHRTLSKALKHAVMDGLIPRNAAGPVKPPRPRRVEIRTLGREQVRALFEAARGDRLEALYVLAVSAGLQRGGLQGLTWEDVDLDAGTLQVRRTPSEPRGGYIFEAPKSGKGRQIRLTQRATVALKEHRKRQLEERM